MRGVDTKKQEFLNALEETGVIKEACEISGVGSDRKVRHWMKRDKEFAAEVKKRSDYYKGISTVAKDIQESPVVRGTLLRKLRSGTAHIRDLASDLNLPVAQVREMLGGLKAEGYRLVQKCDYVTLDFVEPVSNPEKYVIDPKEHWGTQQKFGVVSDTHLCSTCERLDLLNIAYDYFADNGISTVYHAGNIVEGVARHNQREVRYPGMDMQIDYCIEHYPQRDGVTTQYITGDCHEGWWNTREGVDFGRHLEVMAKAAGREDLVNLGHVEADIELKAKSGSATMRLFHPGGGQAQAISYHPQKTLESYMEVDRPDILILGHYHVYMSLWIRKTWVIGAGTLQDQTLYLKKKRMKVDRGFAVIEIDQNDKGELTRFLPNWMPLD